MSANEGQIKRKTGQESKQISVLVDAKFSSIQILIADCNIEFCNTIQLCIVAFELQYCHYLCLLLSLKDGADVLSDKSREEMRKV